MKVVLDTNVVIFGVFFAGTPRSFLSAWSEEKFVMELIATGRTAEAVRPW